MPILKAIIAEWKKRTWLLPTNTCYVMSIIVFSAFTFYFGAASSCAKTYCCKEAFNDPGHHKGYTGCDPIN